MSRAYEPGMIVHPGEGTTVKLEDTTITYKVSGADTNGAWSLVEFTLPPYCEGVPVHWHARTAEAWYVVEGTLALTLDDHIVTAGRGTIVCVPPAVQHTFFNPTAAPVILLAWSSPGGCEQYWAALSALHGTSSTDNERQDGMQQLVSLSSTYDHHHAPSR